MGDLYTFRENYDSIDPLTLIEAFFALLTFYGIVVIIVCCCNGCCENGCSSKVHYTEVMSYSEKNEDEQVV